MNSDSSCLRRSQALFLCKSCVSYNSSVVQQQLNFQSQNDGDGDIYIYIYIWTSYSMHVYMYGAYKPTGHKGRVLGLYMIEPGHVDCSL